MADAACSAGSRRRAGSARVDGGPGVAGIVARPGHDPTRAMDTHLPDDLPLIPHHSHWGAFSVRARGRDLEIVPHPGDPHPSPVLGNIPASVVHPARVARPAFRRGWLEHGPGA